MESLTEQTLDGLFGSGTLLEQGGVEFAGFFFRTAIGIIIGCN